MASSTVVDIADAVVVDLNAATLSQAFTAVRSYMVEQDLKDMGTLHVWVMPSSASMSNTSRQKSFDTYEIDVAVQKRFDKDPTNSIRDGLMLLVEEMGDLLIRRRLTTHTTAICVDVRNAPIYSQEHLDEMNQFTSVLTFSFREFR